MSLSVERKSDSIVLNTENKISPILPIEIWNIIIKYLENNSSFKHVVAFGQVSRECRRLCLKSSLLFRLHVGSYRFLPPHAEIPHPARFEMKPSFHQLAIDKEKRVYMASFYQRVGVLCIFAPAPESEEAESSVKGSEIQNGFTLLRLNVWNDLESNKDKIHFLIDNSPKKPRETKYSFPDDHALITREHIKEWAYAIVDCHPVDGGFILVTNFGLGLWKYENGHPNLQNFFCLFKQYYGCNSEICTSSYHNGLLILSYSSSKSNGKWTGPIKTEVIDLQPLLGHETTSSFPQVLKSPFEPGERVQKSGETIFHNLFNVIIFNLTYGEEGSLKLNRKYLANEEGPIIQPQNWRANQQIFHATWKNEIIYLPTGIECTQLFTRFPFFHSDGKLTSLFIDVSETTTSICAIISFKESVLAYKIPLSGLDETDGFIVEPRIEEITEENSDQLSSAEELSLAPQELMGSEIPESRPPPSPGNIRILPIQQNSSPCRTAGKVTVVAGIVLLVITAASGTTLLLLHPGTIIYQGHGIILTLPTILAVGIGGSLSLSTIAIGSYLWWKHRNSSSSVSNV